MGNILNAKYIANDDVLIGYLDLCGTKTAYKKLNLKEQVNRIHVAVSNAWIELSNAFDTGQQSLFVHMFADSLVIAQRSKKEPEDCLTKLVNYFLTVQSQMLRHSDSSKMPILSRAVIKRGQYYGMLFEQLGSKIDDIILNFSLVGGPTIVEMDKLLKSLPVGVYIDRSLAAQYRSSNGLVPVEQEPLAFVKQPEAFISFERSFGDQPLDEWVEEMIARSGNDPEFRDKLKPWADAIQNRLTSIRRA